jgi:hypothetical protein
MVIGANSQMGAIISGALRSAIRPSVRTPSEIPAIADPSNPDLVTMFTMDNVSGATLSDESPNGNDAALSGGVTFAAGQINDAINYDGIDGKAVWTETTQQAATTGTITGWVRIPTGGDQARLFMRDTNVLATKTRFLVAVFDDGNGRRLHVDVSPVSGLVARVEAQTTNIALDTWYYIVVSQDAVQMRITINDIDQSLAVTLDTIGGSTLANIWTARAGSNLPTCRMSHFFAASSDNVRLQDNDQFREFNRPIDPAEGTQLWSGGVGI